MVGKRQCLYCIINYFPLTPFNFISQALTQSSHTSFIHILMLHYTVIQLACKLLACCCSSSNYFSTSSIVVEREALNQHNTLSKPNIRHNAFIFFSNCLSIQWFLRISSFSKHIIPKSRPHNVSHCTGAVTTEIL